MKTVIAILILAIASVSFAQDKPQVIKASPLFVKEYKHAKFLNKHISDERAKSEAKLYNEIIVLKGLVADLNASGEQGYHYDEAIESFVLNAAAQNKTEPPATK